MSALISAIVSALIAGAVKSSAKVGENILDDGYKIVRKKVIEFWGSKHNEGGVAGDTAIEALEKDPMNNRNYVEEEIEKNISPEKIEEIYSESARKTGFTINNHADKLAQQIGDNNTMHITMK